MRVGLAQMQMTNSMEDNYQKALLFIEEAAEWGVDLLCFPEVQLTPFFPQYEGLDAAQYVIRPDSAYLTGIREACRKHGIYASPNFYIEENGRRYDMSFLIDDQGGIIGRQKMVHIAQAPQFYEQDYYTPSEEGFQVFDTRFGKVGIVVCFDRHYPESVRTLALKGAELILIPTANTRDEPSELFQWEIMVQAFQNSVHIAMCNRVGREGDMDFSGESIVSDCLGNKTALAGDREMLLVADLELSKAAELRRKKPYTSLRRPELYA